MIGNWNDRKLYQKFILLKEKDMISIRGKLDGISGHLY